jgi:hypothetical protein
VLVVVLVLALAPSARSRARVAHEVIDTARRDAVVLSRLRAVIARYGGAARIKSCGQPVTLLGFQSELAWVVGLNVGTLGYHPGRSIVQGIPIVLFRPDDNGWQIRPVHISASDSARCDRLRTNSVLGPGS